MRKQLRKIARMFAVTWSHDLQYRGDIFLWTLTEVVTPLVALVIWFTVTAHAQTAISARDTLTYYVLTMLVISATNSWISHFLIQDILNGQLVRYLTRPISVFWEHITDNIGVKLMRLSLPLPTAIVVFWLLPHWFSSSLYEPSRIALAGVSVFLGAAIAFAADSLLATLAFWIEDVHQIIGYHYLLWTVSAGVLIPYTLLPEFARTALSFLPYRYIVSAPIEILVAPSATLPVATLLAIQLAWLAGLVVALRFFWKRGLKRYAIPGQ